MKSFAEFESLFLSALQQERADLQDLHGASEAQLSAWIEHLFRQFLGYTHWKEITREASAVVGSRGSKQLFPDLRVDITDNGLIFLECKRLGRLEGPKGQEEMQDGVNQLRSYIRAHIDQATTKPKTVLGVVTDGNRWLLLGLNRTNEFHTIAEWAFLTDDPRLLAQRMWLLAKPALAQPTSALIEFLARRTLAEVLKENTRLLTRKVNEKLPDGFVSEELIGRWLREVLSDSVGGSRFATVEPTPEAVSLPPQPTQAAPAVVAVSRTDASHETGETGPRRISLADLLGAGVLLQQDELMVEGADGKRQTASVTTDGKIKVNDEIFDSVSPAALRALELAGKVRKAANGWATFHVVRGGNIIATLLQLRAQCEDKLHESAGAGLGKEAGDSSTESSMQSVVAQLKPILGLLPDVEPNASKSTVSLYAGKLLIGYAFPRKKGLPRLRVYAGESCPDWASPDTTYAYWCYVDDWAANVERVVALLKEAPHRRASDLGAGRDPYRRRGETHEAAVTPAGE